MKMFGRILRSPKRNWLNNESHQDRIHMHVKLRDHTQGLMGRQVVVFLSVSFHRAVLLNSLPTWSIVDLILVNSHLNIQ
uniref:Uncharacterized protein n=1 Tax=Arundo donax TaxID=35708 RepID=A0A0A8XNU3_ARUDO